MNPINMNPINMNPINIFLIANNHNLTPQYISYINTIKLSDRDIIVRFNHCENQEIFNGKTNAIALRSNGSLYWGNHINYVKTQHNKVIYLLGKNKDTSSTINHFTKQGCIVKILNYFRNDYNKTDSSGKQIIDYFRNANSKNKIFLIGFDFHREQKCIAHNFTKEREKILTYNNVIIL